MHIENSLPDPLAFYGFLRISEYTTLLRVDVCLTEERLSIMLCQSKIDPFRHGHSIQLYLANTSTCPLHAFQLYSYLTQKNHPCAPVFSAERFSPLSCHKLNAVTRHLLQQAELNQSDYSSHSFTIEAATTAAAAGIPTWLVMKLCRWTSNAYRPYIHCPTITVSAIPKSFLAQVPQNQPAWNADQ